MFDDQLVSDGHVDSRDLEPIEDRSRRERIHIDVLCPVCSHPIEPVEGGYACQTCQAEASFFLMKRNAEPIEIQVKHIDVRTYLESEDSELEPEVHVVYCQVAEHTTAILPKKMRCLSCGQPFRKRILKYPKLKGDPNVDVVYCSSNCRVRTYLRIGSDTVGIFVAPYIDAYDSHFGDQPHQDPSEIPVVEALPVARQPATADVSQTPTSHEAPKSIDRTRSTPDFSRSETAYVDTQTPKTQKPKNQKKDIRGQILAVLPQNGTPMHRDALFSKIDGTENNIYVAIKKLIDDGFIKRVKQNWYAKCP